MFELRNVSALLHLSFEAAHHTKFRCFASRSSPASVCIIGLQRMGCSAYASHCLLCAPSSDGLLQSCTYSTIHPSLLGRILGLMLLVSRGKQRVMWWCGLTTWYVSARLLGRYRLNRCTHKSLNGNSFATPPRTMKAATTKFTMRLEFVSYVKPNANGSAGIAAWNRAHAWPSSSVASTYKMSEKSMLELERCG